MESVVSYWSSWKDYLITYLVLEEDEEEQVCSAEGLERIF